MLRQIPKNCAALQIALSKYTGKSLWNFHQIVNALGASHSLVSDGALRDDSRNGPDRSCPLDETATDNDWTTFLGLHGDADMHRGLVLVYQKHGRGKLNPVRAKYGTSSCEVGFKFAN